MVILVQSLLRRRHVPSLGFYRATLRRMLAHEDALAKADRGWLVERQAHASNSLQNLGTSFLALANQ